MSEAARFRRDDARHEPQMATTGRGDVPDPLAELARLVGQEDRFRGVFRPGDAPATAPDRPLRAGEAPRPAIEDVPAAEYADHHDGRDDAHRDYDAHGYPGHGHAAHQEAEADYEPAYHRDAPGHGHHDGYDEDYYAEQDIHADEAGIADERFAADAAAAAALPDVWAQGGDLDSMAADHGRPGQGQAHIERSSARRPLAVLAAVLVLTGGGLAASFLVKGPAASGSAAAARPSREAPTIMAATGPTKVKVEDAGATAPEDQDAALLNKNAGASSGPVKIVSSQEQPADLNLLPKVADLADGARPLPPAAPSPFPEPKKVKTFVVHPDGSMLSADGGPAAFDAGAPGPDASGSALPSTPKTAARGGTTPRSAPPAAVAPAAEPAQAAAEAPAARQPASPGVRVATAKPNDAADAPGTAAGGSFGLQLASSPAEADAQAAFAKLKKKYPSLLGTLSATVHRAETGDKPVYRVRVGGMSQDEARSLCSKLQGAGGSCFVVHN